jgi:hypothetical protein
MIGWIFLAVDALLVVVLLAAALSGWRFLSVLGLLFAGLPVLFSCLMMVVWIVGSGKDY